MPTGTIKLLGPDGSIEKQGRYKHTGELEKFKESCKNIYGPKALEKCKFEITEDPKPPVVVKPADGPAVIRQNSPWRKGKGLSNGGSTGKKIPVRWPGKYW